jgi:hypothetical protein
MVVVIIQEVDGHDRVVRGCTYSFTTLPHYDINMAFFHGSMIRERHCAGFVNR